MKILFSEELETQRRLTMLLVVKSAQEESKVVVSVQN
jgi:hypothetical protein